MSQYGTILYLVVVVAGFYLLFIRPQQKRQKEIAELLGSLEIGDRILSVGGMHGIIRGIDGDEIEVEIAEGVVVRMTRAAIARKSEVGE
jgi:preprotein translocase subunit YajC